MPFLGRTPTQLVDPEVDINGGAIDGVTIGATSASPATVTTFTSTGIDDNAASNAITIDSSQKATFSNSIEATVAYRAYDSVGTAYRNVLRYDSGNVRLETGSSGSEAIAAFTGGSERLRIDSSGNVGINITPSYTLDIQAVGSSFNPVRFSGHSASIDAFLYTDTAYWSIGDTAGYGGNLWGGNKTSNFVHAHTNGSERMRIDSSGNVGIGTTSPSSTLHLYGTGTPIRLNIEATTGRVESRLDNTSGAFIFGIDDSGGAGFGSAYSRNIYSNGAYPMLFWTNNAERMRIDSSGKVGIGTTNPPHLLSIDTGSGKSIEFNWWTPGSTNYIQSYDRTNAAYLPMTTFASSTVFHNGSSESGRIDADGLKFNGDTAAANALDDYEEGTYTPTYTGSSTTGTTTYSQNTGVYTKIGRTVTVWVDMTITAMSGASGTPQISLPFTSGTAYGTDAAGSTMYDMGAFMSWQTADNFTGTKRPTGWVTNNSAVMYMYGYTTAGVGGLSLWTLNTTGRISGKIIYTAAF